MRLFGANVFLWAALAATSSWSAFSLAIADDGDGDGDKPVDKTEEKKDGEKDDKKTDNPPKDEPKKEEPKDEPKKEEPKKEEPQQEEKKPEPKYHGNDMRRPRPTTVVPPTASTEDAAGQPPSDAIILFDGSSFSEWQADKKQDDSDEPRWKVESNYFEIAPGSGGIHTRRKFGSCQIHFEWASPEKVKGSGQGRGNSGFYISGHPEVQILDSFNNDTYPDGQAAGIYGHYPPLVNASRGPGEWQTYDIVYMAPQKSDKKDEKNKVLKPATYTVLHNGIVVHLAVEVPGNQVECNFSLQDHGNPIRFRNFWVRPLRNYDEHPPSPELGKK